MDFLYPFLNFLQPGILWPQLAILKPMLLASVIAVIASMRASHEQWPLLKRPALLWATAFAVIQALSVYYSGVASIVSMLSDWYIYPMFMAISLLLMSSERGLRRYIWGMIVAGMFVVFFGIWAKFSGLNSARVAGEYFMGGRAGAYGMYHNQNDYSFIIIQILPFIYLYGRNSEKFAPRMFLYVSVATCVAGILLCLSRGGMLALLLEGFLLLVMTTRRRTQLLLLPVFVVIAIGGIGYQWKMRAQNDGQHYTYEDSEGTRRELWHTARLVIQHNPILGVGSGRFAEYARDYYDLSHDDLGKNAHNTYLDIAATSGLLGLGAFLMMLRSVIAELRIKPVRVDKWVDATRTATLVAFICIIFRAFMDAKEGDWSYYTLAAIAIATGALLSRGAPAEAAAAAPGGQDEGGPEGRRPRLISYPLGGLRSRKAVTRPELRSYRS